MEEIWKDIKGYEGLYQVSNLGNVKSIYYSNNKVLKTGDNHGYKTVILSRDKKQKAYKVHRLVYITFIGLISDNMEINHIDQNRSNNNVDNLELISHKDNCNYGLHNKKLSESLMNNKFSSKKIICTETTEIFLSIQDAKRKTGISAGHICLCCQGKRHTAGGFHWSYL